MLVCMVWDNERWLADRYALDLGVTLANLGDFHVNEGYNFRLPLEGSLVCQVKVMDGTDEGYFYVVSLVSGLRFPLISLESWLNLAFFFPN